MISTTPPPHQIEAPDPRRHTNGNGRAPRHQERPTFYFWQGRCLAWVTISVSSCASPLTSRSDFRSAQAGIPGIIAQTAARSTRDSREWCTATHVVHNAFEGASASRAHRGTALDVIPDCTHSLLERPRSPSLPFWFITTEVAAE